MLVAGLSAGATYISTGPTLAFYLLGPFLIALMLPPLVSMESKFLQRMLIAGAVIDGTALAWLITALGSTITISQWLAGYLVLIAWGFALGGLTAVLRRLRLPSIPAGAIAVAIGLAWLTWPVWLSAALRSHQSLAAALIPFHPPLVVNGLLHHLGLWTENSGYPLTVLGQDVPYHLPGWTALVVVFTIGGIALLWTCSWGKSVSVMTAG